MRDFPPHLQFQNDVLSALVEADKICCGFGIRDQQKPLELLVLLMRLVRVGLGIEAKGNGCEVQYSE
jgi:hypothetical protein